MSKWRRESELGGLPSRLQMENWIYLPDGDASPVSFQVEVTVGKDLEILDLKGTDLGEVREYSEALSRLSRQLYHGSEAHNRMASCPCCDTPTDEGAMQTNTFLDVPLHRCRNCGHGFVLNQPVAEVLNAVFTESEAHSSAYVDKESLELRLDQIIGPKLEWTLRQYRERYGTAPEAALDVGAGGGHFVEGLRRAGVQADGYELSSSSRQFASETFGIELRNVDFLSDEGGLVNLVTFWGLLEYTSHPRQFLETARQRLDTSSGLLVVEVQRLDSLSTIAQSTESARIARHMDPTSHVNTFTDESLATVLVESGFTPVAAWYFGMDAYELMVQIALRTNEPNLMTDLVDLIPTVQASVDHGRQCDDIIVAAVPTPQ